MVEPLKKLIEEAWEDRQLLEYKEYTLDKKSGHLIFSNQ
ncbi:MAG: hypothetical protein K0S31_2491 [Sphingobacterium multivorum]|nr:hypothetical protein [Sphingobacterium multivorum]